MNDVITAIAKLGTPWWKPMAGLFGAAISYLFPEQATQEAAVSAFVLIIIDLLTGMRAAFLEGRFITSTGVRRTINKIGGYFAVVAVCAVVTKNVGNLSGFQAVSVGAIVTLVILTEAVSILENVNRMGVKLPFGIQDQLKRRLDGASRVTADMPAETEPEEPRHQPKP